MGRAAIRDIHDYIAARIPGHTLIGITVCYDQISRGAEGLSFKTVVNFNYVDIRNRSIKKRFHDVLSWRRI